MKSKKTPHIVGHVWNREKPKAYPLIGFGWNPPAGSLIKSKTGQKYQVQENGSIRCV